MQIVRGSTKHNKGLQAGRQRCTARLGLPLPSIEERVHPSRQWDEPHTDGGRGLCKGTFCDRLPIPGSEIASILSAPCSEDELFFWSLPDKSGSVRGVEASEAGLLSLSPISRFCSCTADLLSGVDASFSGTFSAPQALFSLLH